MAKRGRRRYHSKRGRPDGGGYDDPQPLNPWDGVEKPRKKAVRKKKPEPVVVPSGKRMIELE